MNSILIFLALSFCFFVVALVGVGSSFALTGNIDWVANGVSVEMTNSGEVDAVVFGDRDNVTGDEILLQYEGFEQANREVNVSVEVRGENDNDSIGWDGGNITGATGWETLVEENITVSNLSDSVKFSWAGVFGKDRPVNITGNHSEIRTADFEAAGVGERRERELGVRIRAEVTAEGVSDQKTTTAPVITSRVGLDINFEKESTDTPAGFVPDTGKAFGNRNGLTYGWEFRNNETRERGNIPDTRNDTLVHFANDNIPEEYNSSIHPFWYVGLPNGSYNVTFVAGDPNNTDSEHTFDVNGKRFQDPENNGGQTRSTNFVRYNDNVAVTDGNLTFEPPDGAYNPKLNWIRVRENAVPFFDVKIENTDSPVQVGENLSVNYTVTNTGSKSGGQLIDLRANFTTPILDSSFEMLDPGQTANGTLEWNTTNSSAGFRNVTVSSDNTSDTEEVYLSSFSGAYYDVSITNASNSVIVGENATVEAEIQNLGNETGLQDIEFLVNGTLEETRGNVAGGLLPGESTAVTFNYTTDANDTSGITATVASKNDSDTRSIAVKTQGFFDVTVDGTNSPVTEGEVAVVNYTVKNTGGLEDTQDIEFRVNGSLNDTNVAVNLTPEAAFSGSFNYTTGSNDTPRIDVEVSSDNDTANDTVTVNESQAGQVVLTPTVKSTGNSGKYEYALNNTGTINVTAVGIGIRSTTANADRVEQSGGGDQVFVGDGSQVVSDSDVVPIDGSSILGHSPVDINTSSPEVLFKFDRFVTANGQNAKMQNEEVTVEVEFQDGSKRTFNLVP